MRMPRGANSTPVAPRSQARILAHASDPSHIGGAWPGPAAQALPPKKSIAST